MFEDKLMQINILIFILEDQCWTTINRNESIDIDIVVISSGDTSYSTLNRPIIINLFVQMMTMTMTKHKSHHPFPLKCNQFLKNFVISNQKIMFLMLLSMRKKNQGTATSGQISHNNTLEKEGELSKVDKPCGSTKPGESGAEYSECYNSKLEVT